MKYDQQQFYALLTNEDVLLKDVIHFRPQKVHKDRLPEYETAKNKKRIEQTENSSSSKKIKRSRKPPSQMEFENRVIYFMTAKTLPFEVLQDGPFAQLFEGRSNCSQVFLTMSQKIALQFQNTLFYAY